MKMKIQIFKTRSLIWLRTMLIFKSTEIASKLIELRLPSNKNNNNYYYNGDDSGEFGNMDFRSGKPTLLLPQGTAAPLNEKGVNDLLSSTSRTSREKQMI